MSDFKELLKESRKELEDMFKSELGLEGEYAKTAGNIAMLWLDKLLRKVLKEKEGW